MIFQVLDYNDLINKIPKKDINGFLIPKFVDVGLHTLLF